MEKQLSSLRIGMIVLAPKWPLSLYAPARVGDWWDVGIIQKFLPNGNCVVYFRDENISEIHGDFLRPLV